MPEARDHGPLPPLLVLLTIMAGLVDSVSYLVLGNVFVANMTGNIIFLGLGLGGGQGVVGKILSIALSVTCFCAGAATALIVTGLDHVGDPRRQVAVGVLAVSMGWQYAIVRRLQVPDFRTVVVTTTLTSLVADKAEAKERVVRRGLSVAALLLGAAVGAVLVQNVSIAAPLWCATGVLVVVASAAFITARRPNADTWR